MEAVSSLQSLAGYGHGDSDIEDSDEEIDDYISVSSISDVRPQVKSSSRLVSYDDVVEEEEEDNQNVKVKKGNVAVGEDVSFMEVNMETDEVDERIALNRLEEKTVAQSTMEEVVDKGSEKTEWRLSKFKVELPPEPSGRCSNKLQDKITRLLEKKHKENIDLNASVQNRKLYRNPSIYEKLVKHCSINETGTNYPESLFDIKSWTEESFYDNLLKAQKEAHEKKEKEKLKGRTQVEFVSGTKKSSAGEEGKKRKSKWDVSATGVAVKSASPTVNKVIKMVPPTLPVNIPVVKPSDAAIAAAKKPKLN